MLAAAEFPVASAVGSLLGANGLVTKWRDVAAPSLFRLLPVDGFGREPLAHAMHSSA